MSTDPANAVSPMAEELYQDLRRLANAYLRRERARSVQATDLVHEAYLRLLKDKHPQWQNRTHFLAIAAISMRRLLVERARARSAAKRGGQRVQVTLEEGLLTTGAQSLDLVALDRALVKLAHLDPHQARIVELRFFGGMTVEETAEVLCLSPATVKRHWTIARAWLMRELQGGSHV